MSSKASLRHLLWLEPFWILLLGAAIIFPDRFRLMHYYPFLLAGLFLFWPLRWILLGRLTQRTPVDWSIAFLLLWLPLNVFVATGQNVALRASGYVFVGITLWVALINWLPAQRAPKWIAYLLVSIGGGLAIVSLPLTAWKPQFRLFDLPIYDRLQTLPIDLGETVHANVLAGTLVTILPLILALTIRRWEKPDSRDRQPQREMVNRILYGLLTLLVFGVVVLTQSRGAYLALSIALTLVLVLRWPRLLVAILLLGIVAIFVVNQMGPDFIQSNFGADDTLGGWPGRIEIWKRSLDAIHSFVFTGVGMGNFSHVLPLLYRMEVSVENYPHAHNLFLQVGIELGLPGLIAYLALLINLFVMLVCSLRTFHSDARSDDDASYETSLYYSLTAGSMGGMVAMVVHGMLDAVVWGTKLAVGSWILFALTTLLFIRAQLGARPPSNSTTFRGT